MTPGPGVLSVDKNELQAKEVLHGAVDVANDVKCVPSFLAVAVIIF